MNKIVKFHKKETGSELFSVPVSFYFSQVGILLIL